MPTHVLNQIVQFVKINRPITMPFGLKLRSILAFSLAFVAYSCQKAGVPAQAVDVRVNLLDTAKTFYFWNDQIPSGFDSHAYSLNDTLRGEINAIKHFSPVNTVLTQEAGSTVYDDQDGFSRVETESDYQAETSSASIASSGPPQSYGMQFDFSDDRTLRVVQVDHASPAHADGVRRGWQITSINGTPYMYNIGFVNTFNSALNANNATFGFSNASGKSVTVTISRSGVASDEVNADTVVNQGGKVIGYLAYNTFSTPPLADKTMGGSHPGLNAAFAYFNAQGVTDLIIDLRENGGGFVNVAQEMTNAILPASDNGKLMFTENFNKSFTASYPSDLPMKIFVDRSDPLNPPLLSVNKVVFIVNNNTASASELVINNLLPYNPSVRIIGNWANEQPSFKHTRGKPFGGSFFPLPKAANPQYQLYLLQDESKNALGNDAYLAGFTGDLATATGNQYDWADPRDPSYAAALNYINSGTLADVATQKLRISGLNNRDAGKSSPIVLNRTMINNRPNRPLMIISVGKDSRLRAIFSDYARKHTSATSHQ